MNITELDSYNLGDAVKFHRRLNPRIWGRDEHLLPEVREKLLAIADDFQEFLGVEDLNVQDITISGSNAAYSYTKNSDIDLHLVVEMPDNPVYQELFNAKKYQYNDEHNIRIGGADVELYVQPSEQAHHSQGIYSIRDNKWLQVPQRKQAQVDDACVRDKTADLDSRIHAAVKSKNIEAMSTLWDKIKAMRKSGLEQHGEFGCENISFKLLRNKGCIQLLKDAMTAAQDRELSLREAGKTQPRFRYGFSEGHQSQPYSSEDGVAASTKEFLEDLGSDDNNLVHEFIQHVAMELGIDPLPTIKLHTDPEWSTSNHSFGRYDPDSHTLNVSMPNRHILDVLRTTAHELVHCSQNQQHGHLPDDAGETGSKWENDANARAGIIMRDWANTHPEHFELPPLEESASGYIPKNKREAKMPQYAMALSVDIKPGEVGRQANKLALKTGRNGEPGLLQPDAQNLLREFAEFAEEQENLFEISMSPTSLKKLSAQTGARAGMEFEMIVPGVRDEDQDREPDYDYDERARSIDDICNFFYDGDFNGRRQIDDLRRRLTNSYEQWADDQIQEDWDNQGMDLLYQYVKNNVDDETIIEALGLEPDEDGNPPTIGRAEWAQYAELCMEQQNDVYDETLQEFRDDWYNDDDHESDWLDSEGLDYMSNVESEYGGLVTWPHWNDPAAGQTDVEQVADDFSAAIGRKVNWSRNYHGGKREPNAYVVEPDGSLDPDDPNDSGLEFVSPPLPIEELLSDLNTVKAWADKTGCYTNDSTGLHINVSVPGWSGDYSQLDYVKLAVLLGDEYVLDVFGRAGNTYAKSAMSKIRSIVKQNPAKAEELLTKMKSGMDQLASKAIHSGSTEKYTSINTKTGYIEFRSPGGDWLDANFDQIENTLRRFTVALSAAIDPEAYRKEYLKKLYKLLDVSSEKDPLSYFAKYAAGELPKAALKSFVRQARLEREVKRGKETGPMWWRVYKEGKDARNGAVIEVVASSEKEAKEKAAKEWGFFSDEYKRAMDAEPLRPYKEETKGPELHGRPSNPDGNYVIVNGATNEPAYRFMATDGGDALTVLRQWITANPGTQWNFKLDPDQSLGQPDQIAPPRGWAAATQQPNNLNALSQTDIENRLGWPDQTGDANYEVVDRQTQTPVFKFVANTAADAERKYTQVLDVMMLPHDAENYGWRAIGDTSAPAGTGRPNDPTGRYAIVARNDTAAYGRRGGPPPYYYFRFNMGNPEEQRHGRYVLMAWAARNNVNSSDYMVVDTEEYADSGTAQDLPNLFPDIPRPQQYYDVTWSESDGTENHQRVQAPNATAAMDRIRSLLPDTISNLEATMSRYQDAPGSTADLQRQRATPDQQQGGTVDVATDRPAQQPAGMGQWNGQWRVLVNGQEVYRFGGVGNSQADANRIAAAWLRQNGQGVSGEGFEVYPVMSESLREYRMPQPSHGPGAIKDLNEPLGPESPPEMPDGTIKVDVSDMYDWYKLGQKISDLDSIQPGELGSGPPSTVFAFGSEDLENLYSHALTRLGLKTHDLDEPGEEDIDESVSDYQIHNKKKLDNVLARCCGMVERGQQKDPERYGMVAACVIDPDNRHVYGINLPGPRGTRRHAERVAIDKYRKQHGDIPPGSIVVTTLSPCNSPMDERAGESCKDLLNSAGIHKVYCGYIDPTQHDDDDADFAVGVTQNDDLWDSCKAFADTFLHENDLEEGLGKHVASAALAGAMAMGAQAKAPAMVYQIVEPGDTVYSIARQNGANPLEIYRLNKMDRNTKLEVGQRIAVPDYSKPVKLPATVTPTVAPGKPAAAAAPAPSLGSKIAGMIPKFGSTAAPADELTLLSNNSDAEAALQTAAKAAGLKGSELAQFMAQTRHESADFAKMKEVGSKKQFDRYEKNRTLAQRLGNTVKGDGELFKGRGFIQLTGRDNYTRASEYIFGDDRLVRNPDLASRLDVGAKIALWYWKNQVRPKVDNFNDTTQVVRAINSREPMSVIKQRHNKFKEYLAVL